MQQYMEALLGARVRAAGMRLSSRERNTAIAPGAPPPNALRVHSASSETAMPLAKRLAVDREPLPCPQLA